MIQDMIDKISTLKDPRRQWGNLRHKLVDIVFIAFVSVICGGTDFEHMEDIAEIRADWFRKYIELPNGAPDADTFRRVLERLDPNELSSVLYELVPVFGKTVAIDGKTICGSGNTEHNAYHVISAWVAENQMTLAELATDEKSNEITAIPKLLALVDISGSTVTIDAMGCQKAIAEKIISKKADYALALKANQYSLLDDAKFFFRNESNYDSFKTSEKDHGRIEVREYYLATDKGIVSLHPEWAGLKGIGMVHSTTTCISTGEVTENTRYFITSLDNVQTFAGAVRGHWSIESQLHWCLDVVFREDDCRARRDNSPLNLNILRKAGLNILKNLDMGKRVSLRRKMSRLAMDDKFLEKLIGNEK